VWNSHRRLDHNRAAGAFNSSVYIGDGLQFVHPWTRANSWVQAPQKTSILSIWGPPSYELYLLWCLIIGCPLDVESDHESGISWRHLLGIISDWFFQGFSSLCDDWFDWTLSSILLISWLLRGGGASFCKDVCTLAVFATRNLFHPFFRMGFLCRPLMWSRLLHSFLVGHHVSSSTHFPLHVPKYWVLLLSEISWVCLPSFS